LVVYIAKFIIEFTRREIESSFKHYQETILEEPSDTLSGQAWPATVSQPKKKGRFGFMSFLKKSKPAEEEIKQVEEIIQNDIDQDLVTIKEAIKTAKVIGSKFYVECSA